MKKLNKEDFTISQEQGRILIRFRFSNQIRTDAISFDYEVFAKAIRDELGTNSI